MHKNHIKSHLTPSSRLHRGKKRRKKLKYKRTIQQGRLEKKITSHRTKAISFLIILRTWTRVPLGILKPSTLAISCFHLIMILKRSNQNQTTERRTAAQDHILVQFTLLHSHWHPHSITNEETERKKIQEPWTTSLHFNTMQPQRGRKWKVKVISLSPPDLLTKSSSQPPVNALRASYLREPVNIREATQLQK